MKSDKNGCLKNEKRGHKLKSCQFSHSWSITALSRCECRRVGIGKLQKLLDSFPLFHPSAVALCCHGVMLHDQKLLINIINAKCCMDITMSLIFNNMVSFKFTAPETEIPISSISPSTRGCKSTDASAGEIYS